MSSPSGVPRYDGSNTQLLGLLESSPARVLDVGCGTGGLGAFLKAQGTAYVAGVTFSPAEALEAGSRLDRVYQADLESWPGPKVVDSFDLVVCSHVLEHLRKPEETLRRLRSLISSGGRLLIALPNVLHWKQRLAFLCGRFRYTDGGVMDRTHLRFFDRESAAQLARDGGFRILARTDRGGFPGARHLGLLGRALDRCAVRTAPGLFAAEFDMLCEPLGRERP